MASLLLPITDTRAQWCLSNGSHGPLSLRGLGGSPASLMRSAPRSRPIIPGEEPEAQGGQGPGQGTHSQLGIHQPATWRRCRCAVSREEVTSVGMIPGWPPGAPRPAKGGSWEGQVVCSPAEGGEQSACRTCGKDLEERVGVISARLPILPKQRLWGGARREQRNQAAAGAACPWLVGSGGGTPQCSCAQEKDRSISESTRPGRGGGRRRGASLGTEEAAGRCELELPPTPCILSGPPLALTEASERSKKDSGLRAPSSLSQHREQL